MRNRRNTNNLNNTYCITYSDEQPQKIDRHYEKGHESIRDRSPEEATHLKDGWSCQGKLGATGKGTQLVLKPCDPENP